jgi:hypothetical protein
VKSEIFIVFFTVAIAATTHADDKSINNPVAAQFRKHLESADKNKDSFVTGEELAAELSRGTVPDPKVAEEIASAIMRDLDSDHDGKLSGLEIAEGARKAGENAVTKQNVERAQRLADALTEYKKKHDGTQPTALQELATLHLIPEIALRCILVDGNETPWGYQPVSSGNAVTIFSPGPINSDRQYIVALGDGRVLGIHDNEFELDKVLRHSMHVYPSK